MPREYSTSATEITNLPQESPEQKHMERTQEIPKDAFYVLYYDNNTIRTIVRYPRCRENTPDIGHAPTLSIDVWQITEIQCNLIFKNLNMSWTLKFRQKSMKNHAKRDKFESYD